MQIHFLRNGRHYAYSFGTTMKRLRRLRKAAKGLLSEGKISAFSIILGDSNLEKKHHVSSSCGATAAGNSYNAGSGGFSH